jgi:hypothetical protein
VEQSMVGMGMVQNYSIYTMPIFVLRDLHRPAAKQLG